MDKVGIFKGRGVLQVSGACIRLGYAKTGSPEGIIEVEAKVDGVPVRRDIRLNFSGGALAISIEALRALGWKGTNPANLVKEADGFGSVEVDLKCEHQSYSKDDGTTGTGVRWSVLTGGGRFKSATEAAPDEWAARFDATQKALGGGGGSGPGGAPPPPF